MSRNADITLDWDGTDYTFRLAWGELEKLQEATDCGPHEMLDRLVNGTWRLGYIEHTIRLGLIGGGMEGNAATGLVKRRVKTRPPYESLLLAQAILSAGVAGAPDELPGERRAANRSETSRSPTEKSGLPPSTEMPLPSDGLSPISAPQAPGNTPPP